MKKRSKPFSFGITFDDIFDPTILDYARYNKSYRVAVGLCYTRNVYHDVYSRIWVVDRRGRVLDTSPDTDLVYVGIILPKSVWLNSSEDELREFTKNLTGIT